MRLRIIIACSIVMPELNVHVMNAVTRITNRVLRNAVTHLILSHT